MPEIKESTSISGFQDFIGRVYGLHNDRHFSAWDMLTNIERFVMRGLKGIRKEDEEKTKENLLIALSWFVSLMNQFHIAIEDETWKRFPGVCSYCNSSPCGCKKIKAKERKRIVPKENERPRTLKEFQEMFSGIYPEHARTLEHAGVHLAEEIGELSESVTTYRGTHKSEDFEKIKLESADFLSCIFGVFNSLGVDVADELAHIFSKNCHVCKKAPCECDFEEIMNFES